MTTIISSEPVRLKFEGTLSEHIAIDRWLTGKKLPVTKNQIMAFTTRNRVDKGCVIILSKYGKRDTSHYPEICIANLLVSLVFYKSHADLSNWINALKTHPKSEFNRAVVLGMMKPFYLKWGDKIYRSLQQARYQHDNIEKHLADTTTKNELSEHLSEGHSLVIYIGHGRSRGWSGYRGVRWKDIEKVEQKKPIGNILSLSCSSLKQDKEFSLPFGLQWIMEGRCCTFIGTWDAVKIRPLVAITELLLKSMSNSEIQRIDELILHVNKQIIDLNDSDVSLNWSKFKLIGNPFQSL